jgi:hypothetical protein
MIAKNRTNLYFLLAIFWAIFGLILFDGEPLKTVEGARLFASGVAAGAFLVSGIRQWQTKSK